MMALLHALFSALSAPLQMYVAWKTVDPAVPYSEDEWRTNFPWRTAFFSDLAAAEAHWASLPTSDHYYGVVPRASRDIKDLDKVGVLWVDLDQSEFGNDKRRTARMHEEFPLPPSFVVDSGHGYHVYWLLETPAEPDDAQAVMRLLCKHLYADDLHSPKTVLRVPGTRNWKEFDHDVPVEEIVSRPDAFYTLEDLRLATTFSSRLCTMINKGRLYRKRSRSERDFQVILDLLNAGVSESAVSAVFEYAAVGDKYREEGEHYLRKTFESVRAWMQQASTPSAGAANNAPGDGAQTGLCELEDGYYALGAAGRVRLSTFTFEPQRIVTSADDSSEDRFMGVVKVGTTTWEDVSLPKGAFANAATLLRYLPRIEWQWLGSDQHTKQLLLYVSQKWEEDSAMVVRSVGTAGRHGEHWAAPGVTLTQGEVFRNGEGPLVYVEPHVARGGHSSGVSLQVDYPELDSVEHLALLRAVVRELPHINRPEVLLPMLGWFMATPLKPLLEATGVRFPHLNVFGMKGSGKTSTVQMFMRLLGVPHSKPWTPNTTRFVLRALLMSTNAIPVHFGEFRSATLQSSGNDFLRVLLQSYDAGIDARGHTDQTTSAYPLSTPIIIDGEDVVSDPAFKERAIMVSLRQVDVMEGTSANRAFKRLIALPLRGLSTRYLQATLCETADTVRALHGEALLRSHELVRHPVPERVRNNMATVLMGLTMFNEHLEELGVSPLEIVGGLFDEMLRDILLLLPDGSPRALVDDFVEDVINLIATGTASSSGILHSYDSPTNVLHVQLSSALSWWDRQRRSRGRITLDPPAVRAQLRERGYALPEGVVDTGRFGNVICVGLSLAQCYKVGLEVPDQIENTKIILSGGTVI